MPWNFQPLHAKDKPGKECKRAVKSMTNQLFGAPDPPQPMEAMVHHSKGNGFTISQMPR
jgi:hypothetical protein